MSRLCQSDGYNFVLMDLCPLINYLRRVQGPWLTQTLHLYTVECMCERKPSSWSHAASDLSLTSRPCASALQNFWNWTTGTENKTVWSLSQVRRGGTRPDELLQLCAARFCNIQLGHTVSGSLRDGGIEQWRLACEPGLNAAFSSFGHNTVSSCTWHIWFFYSCSWNNSLVWVIFFFYSQLKIMINTF